MPLLLNDQCLRYDVKIERRSFLLTPCLANAGFTWLRANGLLGRRTAPGEVALPLGLSQKHRNFFAVMVKLLRDHFVIDAFLVQAGADAAQRAVERDDALLHR